MIAQQRTSFSVKQARELVADLFEYNPLILWLDMLVSLVVGYVPALIFLSGNCSPGEQVVCFFIGGFALYRVGSLIHEISHMRRHQRAFQIAWNILCGVPLLMPSFFYDNHLYHHNSNHYGRHDDGEYLPLGNGPVARIFWFFCQVPVRPAYIFLRFLLSPLTFLHPRLRLWMLEHCSSFVFNLRYCRTVTESSPRRLWALIELACCLRASLLIGAVAFGFDPWTRILRMHLLAMFVLGLNYVRTLAAHHYRNNGEEMTYLEQCEDSVNITGHWFWTELLFPVGLRYHALHHLFPSIPYHSLGKAHYRLMAKLPADSAYRLTVYPGYWSVVRELLVERQTTPASATATGTRGSVVGDRLTGLFELGAPARGCLTDDARGKPRRVAAGAPTPSDRIVRQRLDISRGLRLS